MPRGRPMNYDKRIAELVERLKALIVARERVEMEARVATQVGALLNGLESARASAATKAPALTLVGASTPKKRGPGKNNPKLKAAIQSYWKNMTPAQRKARIEKMQAGRKKK